MDQVTDPSITPPSPPITPSPPVEAPVISTGQNEPVQSQTVILPPAENPETLSENQSIPPENQTPPLENPVTMSENQTPLPKNPTLPTEGPVQLAESQPAPDGQVSRPDDQTTSPIEATLPGNQNPPPDESLPVENLNTPPVAGPVLEVPPNPTADQPVAVPSTMTNQLPPETVLPATPPLPFYKKKINPFMAILTIFLVLLFISAATILVKYPNLFTREEAIKKPLPVPTVMETQATPLFLSFESPMDESLVYDSEITVKGKTLPDTAVAMYNETDQDTVQSDSQGIFEGSIKLTYGINNLVVTAFKDDGEEKTNSFTIVYDDQVLGTKTEKNVPPGQEKKEMIADKTTVGQINQIKNNSIVLEEKKKTQTEAEVDKNTKIYNQNKKLINQSQLKVSDMAAIVDVASSSALPPGQIKKATKIIVREASSSTLLKRRAVYGVITAVTTNQLTLAHPVQSDRIYTLFFNSQTKVKLTGFDEATIANLAVGQRINAVGDLDQAGNLTAREIHIIPGQATGLFNKNPVSTSSAAITATPIPTATTSAVPTQVLTPLPTLIPTQIPSPGPTESL